MSKNYSNKYFFTRIKKLRLIISRCKGHKSIDNLLSADNSLILNRFIACREHEQ